jgi:hypothetical protein
MKRRQTPRRRRQTPDTPSPADRARTKDEGETDQDKVREASEESFPASDAPSFVATTGSLANGRDTKTPKR